MQAAGHVGIEHEAIKGIRDGAYEENVFMKGLKVNLYDSHSYWFMMRRLLFP